MAKNANVVVKKVSPYPFGVTIGAPGPNSQAKILKLTTVGFLADLGKMVVKVGSEIPFSFELPASHHLIQGKVKVIKTYDRYQPSPVGPAPVPVPGQPPVAAASHNPIQRVAEFHFIGVTELQLEAIKKFLTAIRQF